jgi:hypothetical protein
MLFLPRERWISLFVLGLVAVACQRQDPAVTPQPAQDPDWIKLTVPSDFSTDDQAYALAGELDQTLLVATKTTVFTTSDQGQTWQKSKNFNGPLACLLQRQDTIFAFTINRGNRTPGEREAVNAQYFTRDFGKTWAATTSLPNYQRYQNWVQPTGRVQAAGVTYFLQGTSAPIANSSSQLLLATDLYRVDPTGAATVRLPARHYLQNLHFDRQHRLYVAASGLTFDPLTQQALAPTLPTQGIVYISRQALPR